MRIARADGADRSWAEDEVAPEWDRLADAELLVAVDDSSTVGMAAHRDGELTWLHVDHWHRHEGIATALVAAIPGPLRVTVTTDQLDALRFFQRRGFRISGAKVPRDIHLARLG